MVNTLLSQRFVALALLLTTPNESGDKQHIHLKGLYINYISSLGLSIISLNYTCNGFMMPHHASFHLH